MPKRLPIPGQDKGNWGEILNEHLNQTTNSDNGGINYWTTANRPTGLTAEDTGRTGVNTDTSFIEQWNGTGWVNLSKPVITLNTIQELKDFPNPNSDTRVQLLGYYQPHDCQMPLFWWDPNNNQPGNSGNIITPSSNPQTGRWVRQYTLDENVNHWGVFAGGDIQLNTDGLVSLRDYHVANHNESHVRILFPASSGVYSHTNNSFLRNIKYFTLSGYGAKLQNQFFQAGAQFDVNQYIYFPDQFDNQPNRRFVPAGQTFQFSPSYRINTARSGEINVQPQNSADLANFVKDDWVYISGYHQQNGGQPPNMRYFEYKKVKLVNTTTGRIYFYEPLFDSYSQDWPDEVLNYGTYGSARITNLRNSNNQVPIFARVEGFEFVLNPNSLNRHQFLAVKGIDVQVVDVNIPDEGVIQNSKKCVWENVNVGGELELDKNVERAVLTNVNVYNNSPVEGSDGQRELYGIRGGVGIKFIDVYGCESHGGCSLNSRNINLQSSRFIIAQDFINVANSQGIIVPAGFSSINTPSSVLSYVAMNNVILFPDIPQENITNGVIKNYGNLVEATAGTVINGLITIPDDTAGTGDNKKQVYNSLHVGQRIYSESALLGTVIDINRDGTNILIKSDARLNILVSGQKFYWKTVENFYGVNNEIQLGFRKLVYASPLTLVNSDYIISLADIDWRTQNHEFLLLRKIESIQVTISRVYPGAVNPTFLDIIASSPSGDVVMATINIRRLGFRKVESNTAIAPVTQIDDIFNQATMNSFVFNFKLVFRGDTGQPLTGIDSSGVIGEIKLNTFE